MAKKTKVTVKKTVKKEVKWSKEQQASFALFEAKVDEHWAEKVKRSDKVIQTYQKEVYDKVYTYVHNPLEKWYIRRLFGQKTLSDKIIKHFQTEGYTFKPYMPK